MAEKKQAPLNKLLTIYFYHTRLTRESYEEWKEYKFPGHILYGLPLLENYGIRSVMHKCKYFSGRLKLMLYATKEILFCKEKYDVLYATSFRGIEPVIFLRALGLYRKPIVIWHHTAVVTNPKPWREQISRLFYKGIDQMFLFSRKLIQDSQKTRKAPSHKLKLIHWGPDLPFYDHLLAEMPDRKPEGFISTGKENRDVDTLLQAFAATNENWICTLPSHAVTSTIKDHRPVCIARLHSHPLYRRSDSLRTGETGGTQKLYRDLLPGLPLYRRTDHARGSICPRHPRHLFAQPQLRNRHR